MNELVSKAKATHENVNDLTSYTDWFKNQDKLRTKNLKIVLQTTEIVFHEYFMLKLLNNFFFCFLYFSIEVSVCLG